MPRCMPSAYRHSSLRSIAHQRGVVSIMSAFLLIMLLTLLALVVDTGRLYYEKRNLQKIADMAALDAIARLPGGDCALAPALGLQFALETASSNGLANDTTTALTTECVDINTVAGIHQITADAAGRGIRVNVSHTVPASLVIRGGSLFSDAFSDNVTLSASATAKRDQPTAAFTVGSQLLRLDSDALLGQLLQVVGLNPGTLTLLDPEGLANISVTPSGLLQALGIDISIPELKALSPEGLVELVDTRIGVLGIDELLGVGIELVSDATVAASLSAARTQILNNEIISGIKLQLLGLDNTDSGLIRLASGAESAAGALDAEINLGELLYVALMTGTGERALEIPGLELLGITVEAGIVEPPSLAIGPVGTTAYTAQTRLYVDINTDSIPLLGDILGLLDLLGLETFVHLPISIDLVSAQAELDSIDCSNSEPTADFHVNSTILSACVGQQNAMWSTSASCIDTTSATELIKLLGINVLSGKAVIPGLSFDSPENDLQDMKAGETESTEPNEIQLGDTVEGLVTALLDLLGGLFRAPDSYDGNLVYNGNESSQEALARSLAAKYLTEAGNDVDATIDLILNGNSEIEPLVETDWLISNSIPNCIVLLCIGWRDGTFSEAFQTYTNPPEALLNLLLGGGLPAGYRSCKTLVGALVSDLETCYEDNLTQLFLDKPGGGILGDEPDALTNPDVENVTCPGGILCVLVQALKPILNGVGTLLTATLDDVLGLELGRSDVKVESLSCGVPTLVQ